MNSSAPNISGGRIAIGIVLGLLLGVAAPFLLIAEVSALLPMILLPSVGLVFLYRYSGRAAVAISIFCQLMCYSVFLDARFMWAAALCSVFPASLAIGRNEKQRDFFAQLKMNLIYFTAGMFLAVLTLYLNFGGSMIENLFGAMPEAVRSLPEEYLGPMLDSLSAIYGSTLTAESFYALFEQMSAQLIPIYKLYLPGILFSGVLLTAVGCTVVNGLTLKRAGAVAENGGHVYVPLGEWSLPESATLGMLLMMAVSYALAYFRVNSAETVFNTVYDIAVCLFCIQACASLRRRLGATCLRPALIYLLTALLAVLALFGLSDYIALYGCASAIFGSKGVVKQRMERKRDDD